MTRTLITALAGALLLGGCQAGRDSRIAGSAAPALASCARAAGTALGGAEQPRLDWWEADEGAFTIRVPAGFLRLDVALVPGARLSLFDSANGRVTLLAELGARRPETSEQSALRCAETIGGRPATVALFRVDSAGRPHERLRHGRYVAEATWRDPVVPGAYLTLRGEGADSAAVGVLMAAIRSVQIREEGGERLVRRD